MAAHMHICTYGAVRKKITPKSNDAKINLFSKSTVAWVEHRSCSELWPPKAIQYTAETEHFASQLCLENSMQTLLNFFGSTPQKITRVCMEFSECNWLTSQ